MLNTLNLYQLHNMLEIEYKQYKYGFISEKEYCSRAKPIDMAIDKLEMATLQDMPVSQVTSSPHSLMQEH